jgi:RND family efflux transporter MFP subunit
MKNLIKKDLALFVFRKSVFAGIIIVYMNFKDIIQRVLITILFISFFGCAGYFSFKLIKKPINNNQTKEVKDTQLVEVATIKNIDIQERLEYLGVVNRECKKIVAFHQTTIKKIINRNLNEVIKKGELICEFDDERLLAEKDEVMAELELNKKQLERFNNLIAGGGISRSQIEEVEAKKNIAEARLRKINHELNKTKVFAEFDCYLKFAKDNHLIVGSDVTQGQELFYLYKTENFIVDLRIPMYDMKSHNDYDVCIMQDDEEVQGKILSISPSVEPTSAALQMQIIFEINSNNIAGSIIKTYFKSKKTTRYALIPEEAIRKRGPYSSIFVVKDGFAHMIDVECFGEDKDSGMVKVKGLQDGQVIVTTGAQKLSDFAKIKVNE